MKYKLLFFLVSLSCFVSLEGADRYYKSSADGTWNNSSNWSATSSSDNDNAGVPTSADSVIFDTNSISCSIDTNISILGMNIAVGYTGTITQNAGRTVTIGSSHWVQSAGTFMGGDDTLDINGSLVLSNCTFTTTSGTTSVSETLNNTASTFNHNTGSFIFDGTDMSILGANTFNNLKVIDLTNDSLYAKIKFDDDQETRINGQLDFCGIDHLDRVSIDSETSGDQFNINLQGTLGTLDWLIVRDSDASAGNAISITNSYASNTNNWSGFASYVKLIGINTIGQSWATANDWSDGIAAGNNKHYEVPSGFTLRTPETSSNLTFPGDSLLVKGRLSLKMSDGDNIYTFNDLRTEDPASLNCWSSYTIVVAGQITMSGTCTFNPDRGNENRRIYVNSKVTGNGNIYTRSAGSAGGVVRLNNSLNNYKGDTIIDVNSILQTANNEVIPNDSNLIVKSNCTFDLNDQTETINTISGSGNITLGSGSLIVGSDNGSDTFSGIISETGAFSKVGTGEITLDQTNTYSGATTVSNGTLSLNKTGGNAIAGDVTITGGSLALNQSDQIPNGSDLDLNGGQLYINANSETMTNLTLSGTSSIHYGSLGNGNSTLEFNDIGTWDSSKELTLKGWDGQLNGNPPSTFNDKIRFTNNPKLNNDFLASLNSNKITFEGSSSVAMITLDSGYYYLHAATLPYISSITSSTTDGSYTTGATISVEITMSESITLSGTLQLSLNSGGSVSFSSFTGTSATSVYTVLNGETSLDLSAASIIISGSATNSVNNNLSTSLPATNITTGSDIIIDTSVPQIDSITSTTPDDSYGSASNINITLKFSEDITLAGTLTVTLDSGGSATFTTIAGTDGALATYTVGASENSTDLTATTVTITGTAQDAAGNSLTTSLPATNIATASNIIIDTGAPSILSTASLTADGSYTTGATIDVNINFNEAITLTGTMTVNLDSGGNVILTSFASSSNISGIYTVASGHNSTDLTVNSLSVSGTAQDNAGNVLLTGLSTNNIANTSALIIDTTAPVFNSSSLGSSNAYVDISFSESIYSSAGSDPLTTTDFELILSNNSGNVTAVSISSILNTSGTALSGGETSVRLMLLITGTVTGVETIAIKPIANSIFDFAGNTALNSVTTGTISLQDTAGPNIVNVSSINANDYYKIDDEMIITILFTEAVNVTGIPQITLDMDTTDKKALYKSGSGTDTLQFGYTIEDGDNTDDLNYVSTTSLEKLTGSIKDLNGNDATLILPAPSSSNSLGTNKNLKIDTTKPLISNSVIAVESSYIEIIFSEAIFSSESNGPILIKNLQLILALNDGTVNNVTITSLSDSEGKPLVGGETIIRVHFSIEGQVKGTETIWVGPVENAVIDVAGNAMETLQGAGPFVIPNTIDPITPKVTNVTADLLDGSYGTGTLISIEITFSEEVIIVGSPLLNINLSDSSQARAMEGSQGNVIIFEYTTKMGDQTDDLAYLSATALELNGGSIKSLFGLDALLSLPLPNEPFSLSSNKNISVETSQTVISSIRSELTDGTYIAGFTIPVDVYFTQKVSLLSGKLQITFDTGAIAQSSYINNSLLASFDYLIQEGQVSEDLNVISVELIDDGILQNQAGEDVNIQLPLISFASNQNIEIREPLNEFIINATAGENGTINLNGPILVQNGGDQLFTFVPNKNYHILDVLIDGISVGPLNEVYFENVIKNHSVEVSFGVNEGIYFITANLIGSGTLTPFGITTVKKGEDLFYEFDAMANHYLKEIIIDGIVYDPSKDFFSNGISFINIQKDHHLLLILAKTTDEYTVNINSLGDGSISPNGFVNVTKGGSQDFAILANPGSHLYKLELDGLAIQSSEINSVLNYLLENVNSNHSITAYFTKDQADYTLISSSTGQGKISPEGLSSISSGAKINFDAYPDPGYHISDFIVDGNSLGPIASYSFSNIQSQHSVEVLFDKNSPSYLIAASVGNGGIGGSISQEGLLQVASNSELLFTLKPELGYQVEDLIVDGISKGSLHNYRFNHILTNHSIEAHFTKIKETYSITINKEGFGEISASGLVIIKSGEDQEILFKPLLGYHIGKLIIDGNIIPSTNSYLFSNVQRNHDVFVSFIKDSDHFKIQAEASKGGVITPNGTSLVDSNESAIFEMKADLGYHITDLIIDGIPLSRTSHFRPRKNYIFDHINMDHSIYAVFTKDKNEYQINLKSHLGGSISPTGSQVIETGKSIGFEFIADKGYHVSSVLINGFKIGSADNYLFKNIQKDYELEVIFSKTSDHYSIKTSTEGFGNIEPAETSIVNHGQDLNYSFKASPGNRILNVQVDGISMGPKSSLSLSNIISDHHIHVEFVPTNNIYTLVVSSNEGGSVSPKGIVGLSLAEDKDISIKPLEGFLIKDVIVNGISQGAINQYLVQNANKDYLIVVIFQREDSTIDQDIVSAGCQFQAKDPGLSNCLWIVFFILFLGAQRLKLKYYNKQKSCEKKLS